ncbi:MAG: hypothetical protein ABL883_12855 [Terricaulis sp.]|jgi:hypothetical protein
MRRDILLPLNQFGDFGVEAPGRADRLSPGGNARPPKRENRAERACRA